jgi:glycosyltransferase involved in cell wall biosynthesis
MKKSPLVSVIIPTKNSAEFLENCLKSIKSQTYKNIEMIVVDNNSSDNTKEIALKYTKLVFNKGPERSAQRNFGASKSKGEYLLFIDSDMELSKTVVEDCIRQVESYPSTSLRTLGGIIIPEESVGEGFWAKCKALERSFYVGVDWIEAARFFDKRVFAEMKGYDEKQTGTEDFDLPQRIKEKYGDGSIGRINSFIYHNEGRLSLAYTLGKKFYYAKTAKIYATKKSNSEYFKKQSSILERYKLFFSNPKKLFKNSILGFGVLFMKTLEFAAGGLGFLLRK